MIIRILFVIISFLFAIQPTHQNIYYYLEFVKENDLVSNLIERLYLSSTYLPRENGSFYTYADVEEDLKKWKELNPNPTAEQSELVLKIDNILSNVYWEEVNFENSNFNPIIEIKSGIDYLYHANNNIPNEDSLYFNVFRDRDFLTKFNERSNFFTVRIKSSYGKYIYFSSKFGLRENWIGLKQKDHHFVNNFHEIDNNFNQHAYGTFRFGPLLLNSGRSRVTMGIGNHGKLLLGQELPPLDIFRASIKFGKYFRFYNYMMPLNNISTKNLTETELPKYVLAHRLSLDIPPYIRIAGSEMMIINSYLKWNYLNPLIVYHNVSNANLVNILTSFDIEIVPYKKIKAFLSVAIDEIDFYLIEQESKNPRDTRLAMGIQTGIKILDPFRLQHSQIQIEYLKTDRWLYNYQVVNSSMDLTYTFIEKIEFPESHYFYRFVGHYLGSNTEAIFMDFKYKEVSFHFNNIRRGNNYILDYENTWNESLPNIIENSTSVYMDWEGLILDNKLSIKSKIGYSWFNNYHNIENLKSNFPEFRISLNYRLFLLTDI